MIDLCKAHVHVFICLLSNCFLAIFTLFHLFPRAKVEDLDSFRHWHCLPAPGATISPTIDCFTTVGSITLVSGSAEALNADIEAVREAEETLFDLVE
mgnify:CR=1 FL=1